MSTMYSSASGCSAISWSCTSAAASKLPDSPLEKLKYTVGTPLAMARSNASRNTGTGARRRRTSARTTSFVASSTATAPGTPGRFASSLSFASRYASKLRCQCRWSGVMFSSTATFGAKRAVEAS